MSDVKPDFLIRPAEARDIDQLLELLRGICLLHCEGRPDIFEPSSKFDGATIAEILADPSRPVLVADAGGEVAGYVFCIIKDSSKNPVYRKFINVYIDDFCVSPKYRRMGVGTALFDEVKKLATSIGAHNIDLNVWAFNSGAIEFYKSLGMKPERMYMEYIIDEVKENADKT